jgi:ATP synthase protein I
VCAVLISVQNRLTIIRINPYNRPDNCNYHPVSGFIRLGAKNITMLRIVSLQIMATAVAGLVAALLGGWAAMFSAVLGGLCCVVPNTVFALRLFIGAHHPGAANPMTFFIGEFIKIALTLGFLGAIVWLYHDLNWPALLGGFIVALKSYIILLFRHQK